MPLTPQASAEKMKTEFESSGDEDEDCDGESTVSNSPS